MPPPAASCRSWEPPPSCRWGPVSPSLSPTQPASPLSVASQHQWALRFSSLPIRPEFQVWGTKRLVPLTKLGNREEELFLRCPPPPTPDLEWPNSLYDSLWPNSLLSDFLSFLSLEQNSVCNCYLPWWSENKVFWGSYFEMKQDCKSEKCNGLLS